MRKQNWANCGDIRLNTEVECLNIGKHSVLEIRTMLTNVEIKKYVPN